jgi:hypothetical protein
MASSPAAPERRVGRSAISATWFVAATALAASVAGLLIDGLYTGAASTAAMFRAYDLVTAAVVVPCLVVALLLVRRGGVLAQLVVASLLAYLVYTYAYYLFGTGFNDLFLLHVGVFAAGMVALTLTITAFDTDAVADRLSRTPTRAVSAILGVLAVALGGLWAYFAIDNAVTGDVPAGSRMVETDTVVHLGMALDLSVLVPLYFAAAVLLWRRDAWGFPLAAIALGAGLLHQVSYIVAMPFQVAAEVPGAVSLDLGEPVIVLLYLTGVGLLLSGARRTRASVNGKPSQLRSRAGPQVLASSTP